MAKARIWSRRQDDGTWWWYWEVPTGTSAAGYQPVTTLLVGNGSSQPLVMSTVSRLLAGHTAPQAAAQPDADGRYDLDDVLAEAGIDPNKMPPEPGYQRIADAIHAACDAAALTIGLYEVGADRVGPFDRPYLRLAQLLDKAGLIDWAAFDAVPEPVLNGDEVRAVDAVARGATLIGTHADPFFVAHQEHKHPVEGCGFCPSEEDR